MKDEFRIIWYDSLDSTQTELKRHKEDLDNLTVIASGYQSAGRGQRGNRWLSSPWENLTFSVLFRPEGGTIKASDQFSISMAATLAVRSFLLSKGISSSIKWPNDIYCLNKKICGMLIENSLRFGLISKSIIGIGINVNQTDFSPELLNPVSMSGITGEKYDVKVLLPEFLSFLSGALDKTLTESGRQRLRSSFIDSMYALGEVREFREASSEETFKGKITGITENGLLVVEKPDKSVSEYGFKEIGYII